MNDLLEAREAVIATIVGAMPDAHRRFLLSFERGEPNWALLELDGVAELPAVQWRQHNLDKLSDADRAALVERLEDAL